MDRSLSRWAADYVNLALAVGRHDANFVDAYYGPKAWRQVAEAGEPRPLAELRAEAAGLLDSVAAAALSGQSEHKASLRR